MSFNNPEYDVAISFLDEDDTTAAALYHELSNDFKVFYYRKNQRELAGTDGMESMRKPFFEDSRIAVVLYREKWGKTQWTAIEELAVKDACFDGRWERLFLVVLEKGCKLPGWVPKRHIWYSWQDFGLEQLVGAIKARILENGGEPSPLSPTKRAELLKLDEDYRRDKALLTTSEGIIDIHNNVKRLFSEIEKICETLNEHGMQIRHESCINPREVTQALTITDGLVGMGVQWIQLYINVPDKSYLAIQEYASRLMLPRDAAGGIIVRIQKPVRETRYQPELARSRELGWKLEHGSEKFVATEELASTCMVQFLDLVDDRKCGRVTPKFWP